jgi:anti-sigma B factor antagonist
MKTELQDDTVRVSAIKELAAANANAFRDWVCEAMTPNQKNIDIDLSETALVDSCGLGTLISLHRTACSRNGTLRLLNPLPPVKQILQLTRMDHVFEVVDQHS